MYYPHKTSKIYTSINTIKTNKELQLRRIRRNDQNHHKTRNHQSSRYKGYQRNTPSTGRELSAHNPILRLEVTMKPNDQNQDCDADECCAEGLADVSILVAAAFCGCETYCVE